MKRAHDIRIRECGQADLTEILSLIRHTIDTCYTGIYPPRAVQFFREYHREENIMQRYVHGDILVLEENGTVVATGARLESQILALFVHPGFQHRGYGRALMLELEDRARAAGFTKSELSVSLPSRGFYENLGYELSSRCSNDMGEGQTLDYWEARKPLTDS